MEAVRRSRWRRLLAIPPGVAGLALAADGIANAARYLPDGSWAALLVQILIGAGLAVFVVRARSHTLRVTAAIALVPSVAYPWWSVSLMLGMRICGASALCSAEGWLIGAALVIGPLSALLVGRAEERRAPA